MKLGPVVDTNCINMRSLVQKRAERTEGGERWKLIHVL